MIGRLRVRYALAALFTAVNLVGLGWALAMDERMHGIVHGALAALGVIGMWWFGAGRASASTDAPAVGETRLEQLQQSVDAIALEVERIGEAQRFQTKLQTESR